MEDAVILAAHSRIPKNSFNLVSFLDDRGKVIYNTLFVLGPTLGHVHFYDLHEHMHGGCSTIKMCVWLTHLRTLIMNSTYQREK